MPQQNNSQVDLLQTRFGIKAAAYLNTGCGELSPVIAERLRVARMQAVAQRKVQALPKTYLQTMLQWLAWLGSVSQPAARKSANGNSSMLSEGDSDLDDNWGWGRHMANALPLVVLVVGLLTISVVQQDNRAQEIAEVDAALLTDALPPSAFADAGFLQFLKTGN